MQTLLSLLIVAVSADAPIAGRYPEATQVFHCTFDEKQDKNYDGWPDGWSRRRGKGFPQYVKVRIVDEASPAVGRCLRFDLDGAGAVAYSSPIPVGPLHSYVLEGLVKTEELRFSRVWLSLTLLNENRERLEAFATQKVQETKGWKRVRLGPIASSSDEARLAVIGLHLEPGSQIELKGSASFTDIWLGRLPRMALSTTVQHHLFLYPSPVQVACEASGFQEKEPQIVFRLEDALGARIAEAQKPLEMRPMPRTSELPSEPKPESAERQVGNADWTVPIPGPGYYRVSATVKGRKESRYRRELAVAVVEPWTGPRGAEFGWTLAQGGKGLAPPWLGQVIAQAGIGRVKLPCWYGKKATDAEWESTAAFHERLTSQGIEVIGLLNQAPVEVRSRFDDSAPPTAADLFTSSPKIWYPSLEPVLARLAGQVRYWQLGDDKDTSFIGYPNLAARISAVKTQAERAAPDLHLGLAWGWMNQLPEAGPGKPPWRFLNFSADPPLTDRELASYLAATKQSGVQRWALIEPLSKDHYPLDVRLNDLLRQVMTCKVHGAEGIFVTEPFSTNHGLLDDNGTPGELFLPWRTAALMLAGANYVGTLQLPGGSQNLVFSRGGQATMVVWNTQPASEILYLGEEVTQVDPWGRKSTPQKQEHQQVLQVGMIPLFVTGVNEFIARWCMDFVLERNRLSSVFGVRHKNGFALKNPFPRGISGTAELVTPDGWIVEPRQTRFRLGPGEGFRQPFELMFPFDARSGRRTVRMDFNVQADRAYRFSVYRHIDVGLRDVYIEITTRLNAQGELLVDQRFINETSQGVSFNCELFVPDRQRQRTQITGMGQGRDLKTYRLPDGKQLIGKTLWLRAEEIGGSRVLNYRFVAEQ